MPRGKPKPYPYARKPSTQNSIMEALRRSAAELKGSSHAEAATAGADRIETLEQTLRQLERLIVGSF